MKIIRNFYSLSIARNIFILIILLFTAAGEALAQCGSITFSTDKTNHCSPAIVYFTAQNAPAGSKYYWNTGNGFSQGGDTLVKSYVQPGTYSVNLIVQLPDGNFCDTITRFNYITILPSPTPVIHADPTQIFCNGPQSVTLTDSTISGVSRDWIVDGTQYLNANQSITINFPASTTPGPKAVTLQVRNGSGCESVLTQNNFIQIYNKPEELDFCLNASEVGDSIRTSFSPFLKGAPNVASYHWTFPGGNPSTSSLQNPTNVKFSVTATPQITLQITTTSGCTYTTSRNLKKFTNSAPDTICTGGTVIADNLAGGDGRGYFGWQIPGADVVAQSSTELEVKYATSGIFNISLTYKYSEDGCINYYTLPGAVTVLPPTSRFIAQPRSSCYAPLKVGLYNSSIAGGPATTYTWRIYDSLMNEISVSPIGPTTVRDTAFNFTQTGTYSIALITKVPGGCTDSLMKENHIRIDKPIADFKVTDTTVCTGGSIKLSDNSFPPPPPGANYTYKWKIWHADSSRISNSFSSKEILFVPTTPGKYNVMFSAFSDQTCGDTIYKWNHITVKGIMATVALDKSLICSGDTITASSIVVANIPDTSTNMLGYEWSTAPDYAGSVVFESPASATSRIWFKGSGCYPITLKIYNTAGCALFINKTACVGIKPEYNVIDTFTCTGNSLRLKDSTLGVPQAYEWIANPPTATFSPSRFVQNPSVVFDEDTCYNLSLVAFIDTVNMCGDTITKSVCITDMEAVFTTDDTLLNCAPKTATFNTTGTKGATNYEWHLGDGSILRTNNPNPSYTYANNNPEGYDVKLYTSNDKGCVDSTEKEDYIKIIGPVPRFTVDKKSACDSITVTFTNHSYNVSTFLLDFDDGTIDSTIFIDSGKTITHTYHLNNLNTDSIFFIPTLIARDENNCPEAFRDTIIVYRTPVPDFTADTTTGCAPLLITFNNTSLGARFWRWDFNEDGIIDDSVSTPSYNFLNPDTMDIYLEVTGVGGCKADTLKSGFIKLAPLIMPSFTMDKNTGCDSVRVQFTNTSQYFHYFSMDYGNGAPKDSNLLRPAYYRYDHTTMTADSAVFYPELTVYNSFGCMRTYKDSVTIFPIPKPFINSDVVIGCDPLIVNFTGPTQFVAQWEWDFDGDNVVDDNIVNPATSFKKGSHTIYLKVSSANGCSAEITVPKMINVYIPPQAAFYTSDTLLCPGDTVSFKDLSYSPYRLESFDWTFNSGQPGNSTLRQPPIVQFDDPGDWEVTLAVIDQHGCSDTITKPAHIHVKSNLPPPTINPLVVTVEDSTLVKITWQKSALPDFEEYKLFRNSNPPTEIYSTKTLQDTQFLETPPNDVHTGSNCYFIRTIDECGNISYNSEVHCTIVLEVTTSAPSANLLQWNAYTGWASVQEYEIYRSDSAGKNFIKTGSTTATNYIDDDLCDLEYCYYIVAVSPEGYRSQSNFDCNNPPYVYQDMQLEMRRTTVVDDSYTLTEWDPGDQSNIKEYYMSKLHPVYGWQEKFTSTTDLFYRDFDVSVDSSSYQYKVQVLDDCGNMSQLSDIAKTIKLTAEIANDNVLLTWNHYRKWAKDVLYYVVEYAPPGKNFTKIAVLAGTDSTYIDEKIYRHNDSFYCYRVTAIENAFDKTDTSVSNVTCTALPSRLFVPNAFTPNGDGHNDTFKVSVLSMYNIPASEIAYFRFVIYDRWGNHIYETPDYNRGWDGKFRGVPSPEGVYIFLVRARGYDGKDYDLNGNVTLFR